MNSPWIGAQFGDKFIFLKHLLNPRLVLLVFVLGFSIFIE